MGTILILSAISSSQIRLESGQLQQANTGIPWYFWLLMGITVIILVWMLFNRPREEDHDQRGDNSGAVRGNTPMAPVDGGNEDVDFGPYANLPEDVNTAPPAPEVPSSPFLGLMDEDETAADEVPPADYFKADDLTLIEGIGPKISKLLNQADIHTFKQLGAKDPENLIVVLASAGIFMTDPATWPEQARMADEGRWDDLKKLQEALKGGRTAA